MTENFKRIKVEDKRIINCRADVNQLSPIKYKWAWDKYKTGCANHWMPQEINMNADIQLWNGDTLSNTERKIVKRSLGFFSTADSLVANNIVFSVYHYITNPECRQFLLRQAFEEAIHTHSYQYCVESLGLDEGEIFNMYHEVKSVKDKSDWAYYWTDALVKKQLDLSDPMDIENLIKSLVAYYVVIEGIFFYCGFSQILSMKRMNRMIGVSEQFEYILRDESNHLSFGLDLINQILIENPNKVKMEFLKKSLREIIIEGTELEIAFTKDSMEDGILGLTSSIVIDYLKWTANQRAIALGLDACYSDGSNSLPWLTEIIHMNKEKNFFETKITEYQTGTLKWED